MTNLTINGKTVSVPKGATIIEAARQNGISIPRLCHLDGVHEFGSCRICVVEVEGAKTLMPACITRVTDGMVVRTNTDRVRKARKVLYELLMSDHSKDCLNCKRNQSCELQRLGRILGVETTRFEGERSDCGIDASVSITRDISKCVLCRRCVTACNDVQGVGVINAQNRGFETVIGPAMEIPLGEINCAYCGQCTVVCPVGALKETDATEKVWSAINDKNKRVVVQTAPAVRVAIGEEFGLPAGSRVTGKLAAALKILGFDDVFDTNFAADLTILEEGTEFLSRVKSALTGGDAVLPMITSCSPGWIKYIEHTYPDKLSHLSTCKSPHTMLGALIKSYYAEKINVPPGDIFVVSVMPCTAKKTEISREEMKNNGLPNVDAVLTTRELAEMIRSAGIDFENLKDEEFDNPLGMSSGAADIFGVTGGVMEAALRTVYEIVTGRELPFDGLHFKPIMGFDRVKEGEFKIENPLGDYKFLDGVTVRVAVTSGLKGAKQLMESIAAGDCRYHFIEVMACPGGCIMGGGQPRSDDPDVKAKRFTAIYDEDESKTIRKSHENPFVKALYKEYLEQPNSHKSHELLHTRYTKRSTYNELTDERFKVSAAARPSGSEGWYKKTAAEKTREPSPAESRPETSDLSALLALEAENTRLRKELYDALETVDILKEVISDYTNKKL
ncbi:MAG: 2Fe-2S iron-sulfur cluster binding domain-containing protein [Clostridiales bacterium]|nr:2Fe-2S iron-sulfur cluster binding domain-containing protein [Clostridiales bacterium]